MGYQVLTEQQEEQIKNMRKDGKTPQEVSDFFKAQYQLDIPLWKVNYVSGKKPKTASDHKRRIKAQRKYADKKKGIKEATGDNIKDLVDQLRAELEAYSAFVIKKIRVELLRAISEARNKRIDVGENVEKFKAEEIGESEG